MLWEKGHILALIVESIVNIQRTNLSTYCTPEQVIITAAVTVKRKTSFP